MSMNYSRRLKWLLTILWNLLLGIQCLPGNSFLVSLLGLWCKSKIIWWILENFRTSQFRYPKFKKKSNGGSVRYPQGWSLDSNRLKIPKLKTSIKIKNQQERLQFRHHHQKPSGKWFASFVVEIHDVEKVEITQTLNLLE